MDSAMGFIFFLKRSGFSVPFQTIREYYTDCSTAEPEDNIFSVMKPVVCKSRLQYKKFDTLLKQYFDSVDKLRELQESKEKEKALYAEKMQSYEKKIEKCISSENKSDFPMSDSEHRKLSVINNALKNVDADKSFKEASLTAESEKSFEALIPYGKIIPGVMKKIEKSAQEAVISGNADLFDELSYAHSYLKLLEKSLSKMQNKHPQKMIEDIRRRQEKFEEESRQKQQEIEERIAELTSGSQANQIVKEQSLSHRSSFSCGHNFVRSEEMSELFSKKISYLSDDDTTLLKEYMYEHLLRLRTDILRRIHQGKSEKIDMKEVIRHSLKTNGIPLELFEEKKRQKKPKIFLLLDISGSCSSVSEMMLTFMYLFKDIFTGGCHTFAFVNTLYDISGIMDSDNPEKAIDSVFETIPVKGVYSNYYNPLQKFWNEYRSQLNKQSIVILLGDVRNNKNDTAEEYVKRIKHASKKFICANTEEMSQWGTGDSLSELYSKYMAMYQVNTVSDLINFMGVI